MNKKILLVIGIFVLIFLVGCHNTKEVSPYYNSNVKIVNSPTVSPTIVTIYNYNVYCISVNWTNFPNVRTDYPSFISYTEAYAFMEINHIDEYYCDTSHSKVNDGEFGKKFYRVFKEFCENLFTNTSQEAGFNYKFDEIDFDFPTNDVWDILCSAKKGKVTYEIRWRD